MIKEYMCSNFLASNILHEVAPSHFQNRIGIASNDNGKLFRTIWIFVPNRNFLKLPSRQPDPTLWLMQWGSIKDPPDIRIGYPSKYFNINIFFVLIPENNIFTSERPLLMTYIVTTVHHSQALSQIQI